MRAWRTLVVFGMGLGACTASVSWGVQDQEASRGGTARATVVDPPGTPPPTTFLLPESDLTFQYSAQFRTENPADLDRHSYRTAYGTPDQRTAKGCEPVLLVVGAGDEGTHVQSLLMTHYAPEPPTGGITLQELMPWCFTSKKSDENTLADLVGGFRQMEGFVPTSSMVSYKPGGYLTYFQSATANTKDADGKRRASAGHTLVGAVAMNYKGRIFLWTITANDVEIFNQLLGTRIQFGADLPWPLVPFRLAVDDGKGIKDAVPK